MRKTDRKMNNEFEEIYKKVTDELSDIKKRKDEYKKDIRESEILIIAIIIMCLIISFVTDIMMAKYIFISVAAMMFVFCTFYTFTNERRITARQNKYSESALLESISHIKDDFIYEKEEQTSNIYYGKAGFDRSYKELKSKGCISGKRDGHPISVSNIIVKNNSREIFRGIFGYAKLEKNFNEIDVMTVNSKKHRKQKYEVPYQGLYMYSEDTTAARKVFTDDIFEDVRVFSNYTGIKLEFMINKDLIFFRFFDNKILTKPIANDKETKEYINQYFNIIDFISKIATKLNKK